MGHSSDRQIEAQEQEYLELQEAWIREQLDDDDADENTEGWLELKEEFQTGHEQRLEELKDLAVDEAETKWFLDNPQTARFDMFEANINSLKRIVETNESNFFDGHLVPKMSYSYAVSIMEGFLSDTAIQLIQQDERILKNALIKYGDNQLTLNHIYYNRDCVKKAILINVVNTTFHNIEQINSLFTTLLGKNIDFSELSKIVNTRHDIVHRDGKTIKGEEITISSEVFVEAVDLILRTVKRFQREI